MLRQRNVAAFGIAGDKPSIEHGPLRYDGEEKESSSSGMSVWG